MIKINENPKHNNCSRDKTLTSKKSCVKGLRFNCMLLTENVAKETFAIGIDKPRLVLRVFANIAHSSDSGKIMARIT